MNPRAAAPATAPARRAPLRLRAGRNAGPTRPGTSFPTGALLDFAVITGHLPHPEGSSLGRETFAWADGLRALGHRVHAWVWDHEPTEDGLEPPEWCSLAPKGQQMGQGWQEHLHSLYRPHQYLAKWGWEPPAGAILVAADVPSAYALFRYRSQVATVQNRAVRDALACHRLKRYYVQHSRAERDVARRATVTLAYTERVANTLRGNIALVPFAYPLPPQPVPPLDEPTAYLMADWTWEPNKKALRHLLEMWPQVRQEVPAARLLLAGALAPRAKIGTVPGVEVLGRVKDSAEVLSRASVLAFPCPASTGPKNKVFEAMAWGLPVVTTPSGAEGIAAEGRQGLVLAGARTFATELAGLLRDPGKRAAMGREARCAMLERHSPVAAAQSRVAVCKENFDLLTY